MATTISLHSTSSFPPSHSLSLSPLKPGRRTINLPLKPKKPSRTKLSITCSSSPSLTCTPRIIRCPSLDRHASAHHRLRFVRKLSVLLLSKPRHFLPLRILSRHCRPYLSLSPSRPLLPLILRYPLIFTLSRHGDSPLLSVSLSPSALSLFARTLTSFNSPSKLYRLLLLSSHPRLLLSKLVHLAPDLGLPPNFRSRLCNSHPALFHTVDTSYGRALELISCSVTPTLPFSPAPSKSNSSIIDRPPRFTRAVRLRRGLNLRRKHMEYLEGFHRLPEVNPYRSRAEECGGRVEMKERRACAVVREVLGMTVEKRTLVDHLTHFRKEFGLPNKLRAMLIRHPEMFYVSVKGDRDSVFLVEGYDDKGRLVVDEEDEEMLGLKRGLEELAWEGKRIRRERRRGVGLMGDENDDDDDDDEDTSDEEDNEQYYGDDDGLRDLFESGIGDDWENFGEGEDDGIADEDQNGFLRFWSLNGAAADASSNIVGGEERVEAW